MAAIPKFSRRARWVIPAGVVAVVAGVGIASAITVAQAAPAPASATNTVPATAATTTVTASQPVVPTDDAPARTESLPPTP